MKKLFILVLMVLVGVSSFSLNLRAAETRTIPYKSKAVVAATTLVKGSGGSLHMVTGYAYAANATYAIHDHNATGGLTTANTLVEGGEATQYDSIPTLDFGDDGLPFNTGIVVSTITAYVVVLYR